MNMSSVQVIVWIPKKIHKSAHSCYNCKNEWMNEWMIYSLKIYLVKSGGRRVYPFLIYCVESGRFLNGEWKSKILFSELSVRDEGRNFPWAQSAQRSLVISYLLCESGRFSNSEWQRESSVQMWVWGTKEECA